MKPIFTLGILALAPLAAQANDSSFDGMGGSPRPTRGENSAIRMVSEKVVLTANAANFSTQADFVFKNETSRAQNVAMGFPEVNTGEEDETAAAKKTPFIGFATFVDGQRFVAKRTTFDKLDASGFNTYWIKTVPFAPRQTRRVRVQFRSQYGGTTGWGTNRMVSYSFTGANWRGTVAESVLEVRIPQPGLWSVLGFKKEMQNFLPLTQTGTSKEAVFRHVWKNWQAQEDVFIGVERSIPFWRKDVGTNTQNPEVLKRVLAVKTIRVGAKPEGLEEYTGHAPDGFTYNNTFYVGVSYLSNKLGAWDIPNTGLSFNKATGFDLRGGSLRLQGREGESTLRINGKPVAAGGPILNVKNGGYGMLYVPLKPIAHALGWKATMKGERTYSLERGSWGG